MGNTQSTEECKKDSENDLNDKFTIKMYELFKNNFNIIGSGFTVIYAIFIFLFIDNAEKFYNIPAEFFITEISVKYIIPFVTVGVFFILTFIITIEKPKYVSKIAYFTHTAIMFFLILICFYRFEINGFIKVITLLIIAGLYKTLHCIIKPLNKDRENYIDMKDCPKDSVSVGFIDIKKIDIDYINIEKADKKFNNELLSFNDKKVNLESEFNNHKINSQISIIYSCFIKQQCENINDIYKNTIKIFLDKLKQDKFISKDYFNEKHKEIFEQNKKIKDEIREKIKEKIGESKNSYNNSIEDHINECIITYQKDNLKKYYEITQEYILIPTKKNILIPLYKFTICNVLIILLIILLFNASTVTNKTKYEIINECSTVSASTLPKVEVVILHKGSQIITQCGEMNGNDLTIYTDKYTIKESNDHEYTLIQFTNVVTNSNMPKQ